MLLCSSAVLAALAASGFGSVFAQSSSLGFSSKCASAFVNMSSSPNAECLDIPGILEIVSANGSILSPVSDWLSSLCTLSACTNNSLAVLATSLTEGCSTELLELSAPSDPTTYLQGYYRVLRDIGCLRNTSDGGFCATDRIEESQNKTQTDYTVANAFAFLSELFANGTGILLPPQEPCDDCSKATLDLVFSEVPWTISKTGNTTISNTCGSSFLDGTEPADILEISPSSNTSSTNATGTSTASGTTRPNGAYRPFTPWDGLTSLAGFGVFFAALL
ncbi:hypothetical protein BC827DRAFT_1269893 [Russula dissimulans]|nr:hypothetical protein BC827DRAFT_1269893 [Russula dissimulans]